MTIEEFFSNKTKVEQFLKTNSSEEAKNLLEKDCGKVSDEEFKEIKSGFAGALAEQALGNVAGGIDLKKSLTSPLAKKIYTALGASAALYGVYKWGNDKGYKAGVNDAVEFSESAIVAAEKSGFDRGFRETAKDAYDRGMNDAISSLKAIGYTSAMKALGFK